MKRAALSLGAAALVIASAPPALASGLSGASTMRVQVDVYKGPVGQPIEAQLGELSALLAQAARAANVWNIEAQSLAKAVDKDGSQGGDCAQPNPVNPDCAILYQGIASSAEMVQAICRLHGIPSQISDKDLIDRARKRLEYAKVTDERGGSDVGTAEEQKAAKDVRDRVQNGPLYLEQQVYQVGGQVASADGCHDDFRNDWGQSRFPEVIPPHKPADPEQLRLSNTQLGSQPENGLIIRGHRDYAKRIATISAMMQIEAQRLAGINVARVPKSRHIRSKMAELGMLFGDFAQRISARNSVLFDQLAKCLKVDQVEDCNNASKLPTSDYLRDADPSKYIEAFRWFNANLDSSGTRAYRRDNRIEAIKQLTEDYNWEQINDVYASGQGDVGMVFIKDELGNWNLKSFSNDPTELLAAYRKGADAAISAAVKLARKAAGDPSAALDNVSRSKRLLDLADTFSGGTKDPDVVGGTSLSQLRSGTVQRLNSLKIRVKDQKDKLAGAVTDPASVAYTEKAEADAKTKRDAANGTLTSKRQLLDNARSGSSNCQGNCSTETAALETAVRDEAKAVADLAAAETELRKATSLHDKRKAEQEGLAVSAAEATAIILSDHERALAAISEVSKPAAGASE